MQSFLIRILLVVTPLFYFGCNTVVEPHFVGVWRGGTGNNVIDKFNTYADFTADGQIKAEQQGLRLIDFEFYEQNGEQNYVGVWVGGTYNNVIDRFSTYADFVADGEVKVLQQGLRLIDFEFYEADGNRHFVGVWREGTGSNIITRFSSYAAFIADGQIKVEQQGRRLIDFEYYEINGNRHYVGVWEDGGGSNVITRFTSYADFVADGQIKAEQQGLRLIDFEYYTVGETEYYSGVWRGGSGSNIIHEEDTYADFVADGQIKAKQQGLRLIDFEAFFTTEEIPEDTDLNPGDGGSNSGPANCVDLPEVPEYIEIESELRVVVDFTSPYFDLPRISLPRSVLAPIPLDCEGRQIFPNNFCGFRIRGASRFFWEDGQGNLLGNIQNDFHPVYNSLPESQSLFDIDDGYWVLYGLEFTGPIGACSNQNEEWSFPGPLTKTGTFDYNQPNVRLIIELGSNAEIEFLNYNIREPEALDAWEIWEEPEFMTLAELAPEFFDIQAYIEEVCEESPLNCPIGD